MAALFHIGTSEAMDGNEPRAHTIRTVKEARDLGFQPGTYVLFLYAALLIMSSLAPLSFILSLRICFKLPHRFSKHPC
jgi:hypothetical protein